MVSRFPRHDRGAGGPPTTSRGKSQEPGAPLVPETLVRTRFEPGEDSALNGSRLRCMEREGGAILGGGMSMSRRALSFRYTGSVIRFKQHGPERAKSCIRCFGNGGGPPVFSDAEGDPVKVDSKFRQGSIILCVVRCHKFGNHVGMSGMLSR